MEIAEQLDQHWRVQLRPRLDGITDDEYLWEPAPGCWTVRPRPDGRWAADRTELPPDPEPVTTIAWRLFHIADVLGRRASYHFGDRSYPWDGYPADAAGALAFIDRAYAAWKEGVDALTPERLAERSEGPPGTLDADFPFSQVILHINREVIHHGAEVALLRDLYRATRPVHPVVAACLAGEPVPADDVAAAIAAHPDAIVRAVQSGNADAVRALASLGFDVNAFTAGSLPRAPLHAAAGAGDTAMVELLLELGADPGAPDPVFHATPLGWAEHFGRDAVVPLLSGR